MTAFPTKNLVKVRALKKREEKRSKEINSTRSKWTELCFGNKKKYIPRKMNRKHVFKKHKDYVFTQVSLSISCISRERLLP